jgi:hypothetical protein
MDDIRSFFIAIDQFKITVIRIGLAASILFSSYRLYTFLESNTDENLSWLLCSILMAICMLFAHALFSYHIKKANYMNLANIYEDPEKYHLNEETIRQSLEDRKQND